jgi:hypothetical protein
MAIQRIDTAVVEIATQHYTYCENIFRREFMKMFIINKNDAKNRHKDRFTSKLVWLHQKPFDELKHSTQVRSKKDEKRNVDTSELLLNWQSSKLKIECYNLNSDYLFNGEIATIFTDLILRSEHIIFYATMPSGCAFLFSNKQDLLLSELVKQVFLKNTKLAVFQFAPKILNDFFSKVRVAITYFLERFAKPPHAPNRRGPA